MERPITGRLTYTFVTGTSAVVLSENWDGVVAPALPRGLGDVSHRHWSALGNLDDESFQRTERGLRTRSKQPRRQPRWFRQSLRSRLAERRCRSRTAINTESSFDGMVLEININYRRRRFHDIIVAGGTFVSRRI